MSLQIGVCYTGNETTVFKRSARIASGADEWMAWCGVPTPATLPAGVTNHGAGFLPATTTLSDDGFVSGSGVVDVPALAAGALIATTTHLPAQMELFAAPLASGAASCASKPTAPSVPT